MRAVALLRAGLVLGMLLASILVGEVDAVEQQLLPQPLVNRYGLTRGWFAQAPVSSEQYRLVDAQYHTGELFVLTEAGFVVSYNAVTGKQNWSVRVGNPKQTYLGLGVGNTAVAVINGSKLIAIGRKDVQVPTGNNKDLFDSPKTTSTKSGKQAKAAVQYRTIQLTGKIIFEVQTEHVASAPATVTDEAVFMPTLSSMIDRYDLTHDATVRYLGAIQSDGNCIAPPASSGLGMCWLSDKGTVGLTTPSGDKLHFSFRMRGAGSVSPATRGNSVYAVTDMGEISMFASQKGEPNWNTSIGVGARTSPVVVDKSLFIVSRDFRLFKLNATDGREQWQSRNIRQFLAMTPNRIYALDEIHRLVILDPTSGSLITTLHLPHTDHVIANRHSDQIFLVSSRGVIQELHETAMLARIDYTAPPKPAAGKAGEKLKPVKPAQPATDAGGEDPFAAPKPKAPAAGDEDPFAAPKPAAPAAAGDDPFAPAPGAEMPKPAGADDPFAPAPGGAMPKPADDPFAK